MDQLKGRPTKYIPQRPGSAGVAQTLDLMRKLTREGKKNQLIRELAVKLTRDLPQKDWMGEVAAIHNFVQNHIRYVRDVRGVETLQEPQVTLDVGSGDCDDKSILAASLLEAIGHPTRFVAMGFLPGNYCHVTVQTRIGPNWRTVETTEPVQLGWVPPGLRNVMVRHV